MGIETLTSKKETVSSNVHAVLPHASWESEVANERVSPVRVADLVLFTFTFI